MHSFSKLPPAAQEKINVECRNWKGRYSSLVACREAKARKHTKIKSIKEEPDVIANADDATADIQTTFTSVPLDILLECQERYETRFASQSACIKTLMRTRHNVIVPDEWLTEITTSTTTQPMTSLSTVSGAGIVATTNASSLALILPVSISALTIILIATGFVLYRTAREPTRRQRMRLGSNQPEERVFSNDDLNRAFPLPEQPHVEPRFTLETFLQGKFIHLLQFKFYSYFLFFTDAEPINATAETSLIQFDGKVIKNDNIIHEFK